MKKLSIVFTFIIVLLAGCIQVTPPADIPATPEPSSAVSGQDAPADTPAVTLEPEVSGSPDVPAETEEPALPVVSDRELSYENEYIEVSIHCPEISGMRDAAFQDDINEHAYTRMEGWAHQNEIEARDDTFSPGKHYFHSGFDVYRNDGNILSICERVEFYSGGANVGHEIIVFNLKNSAPGARMSLEDLFVPGTDYINEINDEIETLIAADPNGGDYSFDTVDNDSLFYITGADLVIAFAPYKIASGAEGEIDFNIPLSNFGNMLIPELR